MTTTKTTIKTATTERDILLARRLTDAEVDYVFAHLGQFIEADEPLQTIINWPRTEGGMRMDVRVQGIPVLFPADGADGSADEPFEEGADGVVVRHDLVKSAFYLLSAYQEWASGKVDEWGRFPYEESVQYKLGIEHVAVVNHYFRWMTEAVVRQCELRGLQYREKSPLAGPSLHLSHDVDTVHYFTLRKSLYRCAQVVGLRRCDTSRLRLAGAALRSLLHMARLSRQKDPYWSFEDIQDNEAFIGHKSEWFFLPNDKGPFPPDYDFRKDSDILELMTTLVRRGNTVSLHAPINCKSSADYARHHKALLDVCPEASPHTRQHFLAIHPWESFRAMEEAGLTVDFTFGFSHSEGFRNAYCHPFHPFDHDRQQMMRLTCVPLAMMDVSCLTHKRMTYDEIFLAVGDMLDEVRAFGGVFSLLWHNSTFDEVYHPGITRFYEQLHLLFSQYQLLEFAGRC